MNKWVSHIKKKYTVRSNTRHDIMLTQIYPSHIYIINVNNIKSGREDLVHKSVKTVGTRYATVTPKAHKTRN